VTKTALILPLLASSLLGAASDQKGVEFAKTGGHPLLLDLHVPDGPFPFPAAILVHGGGFDGGSRERNMAPTFQPLADANFAWFSIDYRMAPDFRYRDVIADMDTAVKWLKANAKTYKVDPKRSSSVANLPAAISSTMPLPMKRLKQRLPPLLIFTALSIMERSPDSATTTPARFNMASINGHQSKHGGIWFFEVDGYDDAAYAKLKEISPILALHKGMPPFLEIHGTRDDQVPYEQSTIMCEALHKLSGVCDVITIEAGGHGMSGWKDADQQHYKTEMIAWLKKTLNLK
jgi:acetyl esterase